MKTLLKPLIEQVMQIIGLGTFNNASMPTSCSEAPEVEPLYQSLEVTAEMAILVGLCG